MHTAYIFATIVVWTLIFSAILAYGRFPWQRRDR